MFLNNRQQLKRHPAGAFCTSFPFLHCRFAGVQIAGKDRLADSSLVGFRRCRENGALRALCEPEPPQQPGRNHLRAMRSVRLRVTAAEVSDVAALRCGLLPAGDRDFHEHLTRRPAAAVFGHDAVAGHGLDEARLLPQNGAHRLLHLAGDRADVRGQRRPFEPSAHRKL